MRTTSAFGLIVGAALLAGGPALGAEPERRGFVIESRDDAPGQKHVWTKRVKENGRTIVVRGEDGAIRVFVDGEEVGPDRVERHADRVVVLDRSGDAMHTLEIDRGEAPARIAEVRMRRPSVMLGIMLDEAPASLREHLGIEHGAIVVQRVLDGLSADKGGVEPNDVIVSIDGSKVEGQASLREILSGFKPGEVALIKVIRRGQATTLPVTLQKYDAAKLGIRAPEPPEAPHEDPEAPGMMRFEFEGKSWEDIGAKGRDLRAEAHTRIMKALRAHGLEGDTLEGVEKATRRALKDLEEGVRSLYDGGMRRSADAQKGDATQGDAKKGGDRGRDVSELRRKAERAMRDARRQMLELRDGRLYLRDYVEEYERELDKKRRMLEFKGGELARKLDKKQRMLKREGGELASELEERMRDYETRLARLEDRLASFAEDLSDRFDAFTDRLIERIEKLREE